MLFPRVWYASRVGWRHHHANRAATRRRRPSAATFDQVTDPRRRPVSAVVARRCGFTRLELDAEPDLQRRRKALQHRQGRHRTARLKSRPSSYASRPTARSAPTIGSTRGSGWSAPPRSLGSSTTSMAGDRADQERRERSACAVAELDCGMSGSRAARGCRMNFERRGDRGVRVPRSAGAPQSYPEAEDACGSSCRGATPFSPNWLPVPNCWL
jgi:hypothetical protein